MSFYVKLICLVLDLAVTVYLLVKLGWRWWVGFRDSLPFGGGYLRRMGLAWVGCALGSQILYQWQTEPIYQVTFFLLGIFQLSMAGLLVLALKMADYIEARQKDPGSNGPGPTGPGGGGKIIKLVRRRKPAA